jgi:hypothetical protein
METLRFRSRACCQWSCGLLAALALQLTARADQIIYDDTLENSWQNWSWSTTVNFNNTGTYVHSGAASISATITSGWSALSLWHSAQDSSVYTNLTFWINGGASGGQQLQIYAEVTGTTETAISLPTLAANTWQQMSFSLSALGVANQPNFIRFSIQDRSGAAEPTFYVDDIVLVTNNAPPAPPGTNAPVAITVDAQLNRHSISPLIYGTAFASSNQLADLNFTMNRSGGNSETRYNWQLNAHNHAADWYFESIDDGSATPAASGDDFVANSRNGGAQALITIPMIGWLPILGPSRGKLASYSIVKYGPQPGNDSSWMPDAGNGIGTNSTAHTSWLITSNSPTDANFLTNSAFQQAYVQHLINQWGSSTNGGVRYYIMDNEHSIWFSTHQDVHPVGPTMEEIATDMVTYASMVKSNDPNVLVCGPEEFGWSGYFFSGFDQQWAGLHNDFNTADYPDRKANGGWDYMPWLLNQIHQHDLGTAQRLLDYFTLHCYPQGGESGNNVSTSMQLLRNESTRQLWDTNYVDQSWISTQSTNTILMLIPRMKNWVAAEYPGTKIGITEYNWGAESYINGATAQADILGIFGWQGLDLATRWTTPATNTPTYLAMKIYRNYDGNKSTFGDTSILTVVPNPDNLSAFGAVRTSDGAMTLMVINKDLNNATPITATITNFANSGTAQAWQLTASNVITRLADVPYANGTLSNTLPAQSITLFVLPTAKNLWLRVGTNAPPQQMELWMDGQGGQRYLLQSSTNLTVWSAVSTNTFASNSFRILVGTTNPASMFYRGLLNLP